MATATACATGSDSPTETLAAFYEAVQAQDLDRLYCLSAGAVEAPELGASEAERRRGFERWVRALDEAYEAGRDEGRVELDPQGYLLVRLLSLGRGTFATHEVTGRERDRVLVESRLRFGYAHVDLSPLPPGTTFYACGAPVGRVHALRVPAGRGEVGAEVLDAVTVAWTLVRAAPGATCPARWAVASAEPVVGSAETIDVTWSF